MRTLLRSVLASTLALSSLAACTSADDQAFDRWKDNEPERYVVQTCTMGTYPPGCVRAAVENGEVVSIAERIYSESSSSWQDFTEAYGDRESPLDAMFSPDKRGDGDCAVDDVRYDSELGYVESYALRCDSHFTGGRWVACFKPGTLDVESCDVVP